MRFSAQREAIWEWIRDRHDHPTAEEIYQGVSEQQPGIGLATVYRNLYTLEELGKIQSVDVGDGVQRFDPLTSGHAHFKCSVCGSVQDVPESYSLDLCEAPLSEIGAAKGYKLCFFGVCKSCQDKSNDACVSASQKKGTNHA